jgi:hypothetical protein
MDNSIAEYWNAFAAQELIRPFIMLAGHIKISVDGNQWCVLYGENLQDGVAGFGDSPEHASRDFDVSWHAKLPATPIRPVKPTFSVQRCAACDGTGRAYYDDSTPRGGNYSSERSCNICGGHGTTDVQP